MYIFLVLHLHQVYSKKEEIETSLCGHPFVSIYL